jgi:UDP-glucose 4-epimerase
MRVLLTGAAGFLGRRVLALLLSRGFEVVAVTRREIAPQAPRLTRVTGDLAELDLASASVGDVDAICHTAANVSVGDRLDQLASCMRDNVMATSRLIRFALDRGIGRFVFTSSVAVYERPVRVLPVDEEYPATASSFYAASKRLGELALGAADVRAGLASFALRASSIYGPRMRPGSVLPLFVGRAERGEPIRILGNGDRSQDFVFVDDVARAHLAALEAPAPQGLTVCNVGTGVETSLKQLARASRDVFDVAGRCRVEHLASPDAPEDRFVLDVTRLRDTLGVAPMGLVEGLRRMKEASERERDG